MESKSADQPPEWTRESLEAAVIEGLESGDPIEVTPEFWRELREELMRYLDAREASGGCQPPEN